MRKTFQNGGAQVLELKIGLMTDEEMAVWCGKSLASYKKNRKRWAETKLINYATYELQRGGINILSIKDPIYSASGRKEIADKWEPYWGYGDFKVDTNKDCWFKLKPQLTNTVSDSTGQKYISEVKCESYGVAYKKRKREGSKGYCHYVFCKLVDGKPQPFTEKDLVIKAELEKKYLKDQTQQTYELQALLADFKRGELSKEDYQEAVTDLLETDYGWDAFQTELNKALGCETDFRVKLVDRAWETNPGTGFDF